jgi:hypothetical protein
MNGFHQTKAFLDGEIEQQKSSIETLSAVKALLEDEVREH